MKKIFAILISLMLSIEVFAEIKSVSQESLKEMQSCVPSELVLQVAYVTDSWKEVYKRTGTGKYDWIEGISGYDASMTQFVLILSKARIKTVSGNYWFCWEYSGDGTYTTYITQVR